MVSNERTAPDIGDLAKDSARKKVGVLVDRVAGRYLMRPVAGGLEWEVEPGRIERLTAREELSARNEARNAASRQGL
ncbi:hypothetical protein [Streptomyces montanisoli]|uniref:Uncharacterized protein n=1 Tax=Streptomyces montanisoli TaxID=2798581 RepID=A0A940MM06_9ACTN|nr:hypothetical protein [Streptomyces montanisoli]MBP0460878.1 hypothetical protein [Streptomyces montanisoli]